MSAADGNWKITINTPMGAQEVAASITTSGDTFTGKTSGRMGDAEVLLDDAQAETECTPSDGGALRFRETEVECRLVRGGRCGRVCWPFRHGNSEVSGGTPEACQRRSRCRGLPAVILDEALDR